MDLSHLPSFGLLSLFFMSGIPSSSSSVETEAGGGGSLRVLCEQEVFLTVKGSAHCFRRRLSEQLAQAPTTFKRDPEDPSAVALKEPWEEKVR